MKFKKRKIQTQTQATDVKILIIEDDYAIQCATKDILENCGFKVEVVQNGAEALVFLNANKDSKPGLILLDLMMPVMDGWQFLEKTAKDEHLSSIPVVVCSAVSTFERPIHQKNVKATLLKPISIEQLLTYANRYCGPQPLLDQIIFE